MEERTVLLLPVVACVIQYTTPPAAAPIGPDLKPLFFDDPHDDSPRFLMGKRLPEKNYGGLWEFPGGCVRPEESLLDAAKRELKEELNAEVVTSAIAHAFEITIPGYFVQFLYVHIAETLTIKLTAHSDVKLIALSKMEQYPMTPASAAFAMRLLKKR